MASGGSSSSGTESLTRKSNKIFNYQQTHKAELPVPPTPNQSKTKRVYNSRIFRKNKILHAHDKNRKLDSYGFIKMPNKSAELPKNFSAPIITSTNTTDIPVNEDQTNKLNAEIAQSIMEISKIKENFNIDMNHIMQMSENRDTMFEAIKKLCQIAQIHNEKMCTLQEATQKNLLNLLALQKDIEVNNIRRDAAIADNADKIQSIETKMACNKDMHKLWITFTCDREVESLKQQTDLITQAKYIFQRLDIDVDNLGIIPIRSAYIQHIKVGNNVIPTLCVAFMSDRVAAIVRKKMMRFNVKLEEENRLNELRYSEKIFWSKDVWKLLKICWELKRLKLVEYVNVQIDGIRVQYNYTESDSTTKSRFMIITNFNDIDKLRISTGDIFPDQSCTILYSNHYFRLSFSERDAKRSGSDMDFSDEDEEEFLDTDKTN